mmetsp:Transcript_4546/g.9838  ORF Transcript_4546/g.9838 Transcript_4546/m.9838 type:complete len:244 (-) Transcript_4546:518-1249(-)
MSTQSHRILVTHAEIAKASTNFGIDQKPESSMACWMSETLLKISASRASRCTVRLSRMRATVALNASASSAVSCCRVSTVSSRLDSGLLRLRMLRTCLMSSSRSLASSAYTPCLTVRKTNSHCCSAIPLAFGSTSGEVLAMAGCWRALGAPSASATAERASQRGDSPTGTMSSSRRRPSSCSISKLRKLQKSVSKSAFITLATSTTNSMPPSCAASHSSRSFCSCFQCTSDTASAVSSYAPIT